MDNVVSNVASLEAIKKFNQAITEIQNKEEIAGTSEVKKMKYFGVYIEIIDINRQEVTLMRGGGSDLIFRLSRDEFCDLMAKMADAPPNPRWNIAISHEFELVERPRE